MKKQDGTDPCSQIWEDLIYRAPQDIMERLGLSVLKEDEPRLYSALYDCLVVLTASKRFLRMVDRLGSIREKDSYFTEDFLPKRADSLLQKKSQMSATEKLFFEYEAGLSVLNSTYDGASSFYPNAVCREAEEGIRTIGSFYREQFHRASFAFHSAMFGAQTIEMDSPAANGLKLIDKAFEQDKRAWNGFQCCYSLKDYSFIEKHFWDTVRSYVSFEKMASLKRIAPHSERSSLPEPVGVAAHCGVGNVPFWAGNPKSRENA